jgi:hypothetical protein
MFSATSSGRQLCSLVSRSLKKRSNRQGGWTEGRGSRSGGTAPWGMSTCALRTRPGPWEWPQPASSNLQVPMQHRQVALHCSSVFTTRNSGHKELCYFLNDASRSLRNLYCIITVIKSVMRWVGHVARMESMKIEYKVLIGKSEG